MTAALVPVEGIRVGDVLSGSDGHAAPGTPWVALVLAVTEHLTYGTLITFRLMDLTTLATHHTTLDTQKPWRCHVFKART